MLENYGHLSYAVIAQGYYWQAIGSYGIEQKLMSCVQSSACFYAIVSSYELFHQNRNSSRSTFQREQH